MMTTTTSYERPVNGLLIKLMIVLDDMLFIGCYNCHYIDCILSESIYKV